MGEGWGVETRSQKSAMAARRAALGIKKKEGDDGFKREDEREGGVKLNWMQASMQARSKVRPAGTMTGSNMREDEIGQIKLMGTIEEGEEIEGEGGALEEEEEEEDGVRPKENFHRDLEEEIGISLQFFYFFN